MGYLEGLLGGFSSRKREVEQENLRQAELTAARESKIFETLLNSPDKETRDLATAGLLQSAGPMRKKGGLRGWLGEMESSPYLEKIRALSPEVADASGAPPPPTAGAPAAGMVSTPPSGSLAQSPTAATQVGAPPLRAIETPPQGGPGATVTAEDLPPGVDEILHARPEEPPPPIPSLGVTAGIQPPAGPAGASLTGQAAAPRMVPRQVFQTQEQQTLSRYSAQERGEILGVVAAYEAVGVPHEQAVQRAIEERMRSRGMAGSGMQSIAGEMPDGTPAFGVFNRATGKYIDPNTQQPLEGFRPRTTTGSTSLGTDRESLARQMFGKPAARLTPTEMAAVNDRLLSFSGERAGAVTSGRGEAAADIPLSTQQRFQATTDLSKEWQTIQGPVREMERQALLMKTGLDRYESDPIGGSQVVLVTFQKILDPTSVVRESEYARSPQGLAIMDRLQGMYERYKSGGAGVPKPVLAEMVATANQFLQDMKGWNDQHKQRIFDTATSYQIDPRLVLGTDMPTSPGGSQIAAPPPVNPSTTPGAPPPAPPPAAAGPVATPPPASVAPAKAPASGGKGAPGPEWQMINGVLHHNGKPY